MRPEPCRAPPYRPDAMARQALRSSEAPLTGPGACPCGPSPVLLSAPQLGSGTYKLPANSSPDQPRSLPPCSPPADSWPVGSLASAPEGPGCEQVLGVPLLAPGGGCLGALLLGVVEGGLNIGVVRSGLLLASRLAIDHQGDLAGLAEELASVLLPAAHHGAVSSATASEPVADSDGGSQMGGSDTPPPAVGYSSDSAGFQLFDSDNDRQQQRRQRRRAGGGSDSTSPADGGRGQALQQGSGQLPQGMSWLLRFANDSLERRFLEWHAWNMIKVGVGSYGGW